MLTAKQEKFIQGIVKGMSQREAYKSAYKCERMSDNAIDREASLLMKNPKVAQRHKELGAATEKETVMTAQERLEYLTRVVKEQETETVTMVVDGFVERVERLADFGAKMKAIDLMNKMTGEYVTKVEGNLSVKLEDLL